MSVTSLTNRLKYLTVSTGDVRRSSRIDDFDEKRRYRSPSVDVIRRQFENLQVSSSTKTTLSTIAPLSPVSVRQMVHSYTSRSWRFFILIHFITILHFHNIPKSNALLLLSMEDLSCDVRNHNWLSYWCSMNLAPYLKHSTFNFV